MYISYTATIFKRILPFIAIVLVLSGCANLDVAQKAYEKGDINKSIKIWKKWADRGYGKYALKLANLAQKGVIKENDEFIIKEAKKAYKGGEKKAAFILEKTYYKKGDYKNALEWFKKSDLNLSNSFEIYKMDINLIKNYVNDYKEKEKLLKRIEDVAKKGNVAAAFNLGEFYSSKSPFYNLKKALKFYDIAYKKGFLRAGIKKALILIYDLHKEKEGLDLLREISKKDNGEAAYYIGLYLNNLMKRYMNKINTPCIDCAFKTPKEFYIKKIELIKFKNKFIWKNIVPWFNYSYKRGFIRGKLKLIMMDINSRNYIYKPLKMHYSGMDINTTQRFLKSTAKALHIFAPKMTLAWLYYKYPELHKQNITKQIYYEYMDINKTDALWHLYLYAKIYEPNEKIKYLKPLVKEKFVPALIENAYNSLLQHKDINESANILKIYANENNLLALHYLGSVYAKGILKPKTKACEIYKKTCKFEPVSKSLDLKIANAYMNIVNPPKILKAATIYKFYADQNDSYAAFKLAQIYKNYDLNESIMWLKKAKETGYSKADLEYAKLVLKGLVNGDTQWALKTIRGSLNTNPRNYLLLGNLYASGNKLEFNPQKAEYYYNKALEAKNYNAYLKLATLYEKLDLYGNYKEKIIGFYNLAITHNVPKAKYLLAKYYVRIGQNNKALSLLKGMDLSKYPDSYYLMYKLTGNKKYLKKAVKQNIGKALLDYAIHVLKTPESKLFYALRASMCNTPKSADYVFKMMKRINKRWLIEYIYKKAKSYPKCH